jgi:hypothetical protein
MPLGTPTLGIQAIAAVALIVLLGACAGPQAGPSPGDDLSTSETQFYSFQRALPLPVFTSPGDTLYRNPMLATDVLEVLADGRPVSAKPASILFAGMDVTPVTVQSGTYIYTFDLDRTLFWKGSKQWDRAFVEYAIPENAEVLKIIYRLVPYKSDPEPRIYTLTARRAG